MKAILEYVEGVLRNGLGREWGNALVQIPKEQRANSPFTSKTHPHLYASPYRPLPIGSGLEESGAVVFVIQGARGLIATPKPLSMERIYRLELVPFPGRTTGALILDLAKARGHPVELMHTKSMTQGALLFKNPRGKWQMSYFEAGVGPTGHEENDLPEELAAGAHGAGYRTWAPGFVDSLMEGLRGIGRLGPRARAWMRTPGGR